MFLRHVKRGTKKTAKDNSLVGDELSTDGAELVGEIEAFLAETSLVAA